MKTFEDSVWRNEFATLLDYYTTTYPSEYYEFTKYQLEVDPDENIDEINAYDINRQRLEYAKCAMDFFYFAQKYIRIIHPKKGLIPFICYKYQRRVIAEYDKHRFNIISKFRQGGLTTLTELWGMWRCMFKEDQQILFLSKTDSEAITAGEIVNTAAKHLPTWMQPSKDGKWNDHQKHFPDTGGRMVFGTPERARGLAITYLILDEAAFIPEMEKHWKAMYPTLSTGGNCIVISTVNGLGNWYEKEYHKAKKKKNKFHVIDLEFTEHPEYNKPEWVLDQKAQLGPKGWLQEVLRSFLGSGETYIPNNVLGELKTATERNYPIRKLFKKWVGEKLDSDDGFNDEELDSSWEAEGALWVWKEPHDGHEYIMGIDAADGMGEEGDNSCIQLFDSGTLEQVAEFYSNTIQPHQLAQIANELGIYYNHALIVVENLGPGGAVLSNLQFQLFYDNLWFESSKNKNPKPGLKVTVSNRGVILEALQHRCMSGRIKINSRRLVKELFTFIYNAQTHKVEAAKGEHDDAIMATCLAIFVRDSVLRDIPIGAAVPKELTAPMTSLSYEEIKKEIMEGAPKNIFETDERRINPLFVAEDEIMPGVAFEFRRKLHSLLNEFGW